MLSPSKAIIVGSLIVAIWGVTLIPEPVQAQAATSGAVTEDVPPTWVTGRIQPVDGTCSRLDVRSERGASRAAYECDQAWTSSDPRLTGDVSRPWNEDSYQTDEGAVSVTIDAPYLRNEAGAWACTSRYLVKGASPTEELLTDTTFTCAGNGGYEGLSAVLVSERTADSFAEGFVGLIFSGDLPPMPEAPAAESPAAE